MIPCFLKKFLGMRSFLAINLIVLFFLSLSFGRTFLRNASIQNEINVLEGEKAELSLNNISLLDLAQQLQTKFYVEKEGRKKYGLQKDGEKLVIVGETEVLVVGEDVENILSEEEAIAQALEIVPNPRRWWWYFFDRSSFEELAYGGD
ncbi:MAG: septum formation initiator family protein [Patescibacteria group bacterium]